MQSEIFVSELCSGKAMVAYSMPQQRKEEENEGLRGQKGQIKFIDLGFERWQVVRFRKASVFERGNKRLHCITSSTELQGLFKSIFHGDLFSIYCCDLEMFVARPPFHNSSSHGVNDQKSRLMQLSCNPIRNQQHLP